MNSSKYRFTLDLHSIQAQTSIPALLGDTSRSLHINFTDGGSPYFIETGCLAKITIRRPTGTFLEEFCEIENNTTVVYHFNQNTNTCAVEGIHECDVVLYDAEGGQIASPSFSMVVSERVIRTDDLNLSDEDKTAIDNILHVEASRVANETERINAEADRKDAEDKRRAAEDVRKATHTEIVNKLNNGEFDGKDGANGMPGRDGQDGEDGKDGVSPTITVTAITGGHRVTITDAEGTKSFDVMNGDSAAVATLSEITLFASEWVGEESPYSQEVNIYGITQYTKVDLLPSVEQLAIFHNKDLAFVTENEDCVVKVYAIGDKPTSDYTMQVSLSEVII